MNPSRRQFLMSIMGQSLPQSPNILFIAIDDLNDWIGCSGGHPQAQTPHLDRLAQRGTLFSRAYCPAPDCNASRTAVMTGIHPITSGIFKKWQSWKESRLLAQAVSMPQYFTAQGYMALGSGKIFDEKHPFPKAWQKYWPSKKVTVPQGPVPAAAPASPDNLPSPHDFEWGPLEAKPTAMADRQVADWVAGQLQKSHPSPFFMGCGFSSLRLPRYLPQQYFDLYPLDSIILPQIKENELEQIPAQGKRLTAQNWFRRAENRNQWAPAVQSYLAGITFVDECVGRVIEALDKSAHHNNTLIVLWSDHGVHLGQKCYAGHETLWEPAIHSVLMFAGPNIPPAQQCATPVSLLDIYPTLIELCGLEPLPGLEGKSLYPLFETAPTKWDRPVLTSLNKQNHSLRSGRWHYIRYGDGSEELYDQQADPPEWENLAGNPDYAETKQALGQWLPETAAPKPQHKPEKRGQKQPVILNDFSPVSCICLYTGDPQRLEEAVYSFLQQDYGGPKELVILNDDPAQTLLFDHPEVKIVNRRKAVRSRPKKWNTAVDLCSHNLIFVWDADDISLPHRLSISVKKLLKAAPADHYHFLPSTIFIWENERVSGPFPNLFHKGSCWSLPLFNAVGGFRKIQHKTTIIEPQLLAADPPRYGPVTPDENYYIFRGLNYVTDRPPPQSAEIKLNPQWRTDYSRLVQDQLAAEITPAVDLSLPELSSYMREKLGRFGSVRVPQFYVFADRKLVYISNAKVACTSIKTAMMHPYNIQKDVHSSWGHICRGVLAEDYQDFFSFSFVRNPFDRLVSGYRNKIFDKPAKKEFGSIPTNITFAEFVVEVVKRPDCLINGHFQSQVSKLYRHGELMADYLGRFENLAEDWLTIANRFEFDSQLPHKMKSSGRRGAHKDYRAYYTEELVNLVYNRFRADVETFGYQDAYEELLAYVRGEK
jgi:choline-sulfatase